MKNTLNRISLTKYQGCSILRARKEESLKKVFFIFILIFLIGCAGQHKTVGTEVDKYIQQAEEYLKIGELDIAI